LLVVVAAAGLGKLPHGEPSDGLPNFQLNDFTKVGGTSLKQHTFCREVGLLLP